MQLEARIAATEMLSKLAAQSGASATSELSERRQAAPQNELARQERQRMRAGVAGARDGVN